MRNKAALHIANQRQEVFAQRVNQIFRQRKTEHLFNAADQQRDSLFNLIAIARRMRHAVAAVETIFKYRTELVFEDCQRFGWRHVAVTQVDIFAGQEAVEKIALFNFGSGGQRIFQRGQRAGIDAQVFFAFEQRSNQQTLFRRGVKGDLGQTFIQL